MPTKYFYYIHIIFSLLSTSVMSKRILTCYNLFHYEDKLNWFRLFLLFSCIEKLGTLNIVLVVTYVEYTFSRIYITAIRHSKFNCLVNTYYFWPFTYKIFFHIYWFWQLSITTEQFWWRNTNCHMWTLNNQK